MTGILQSMSDYRMKGFGSYSVITLLRYRACRALRW